LIGWRLDRFFQFGFAHAVPSRYGFLAANADLRGLFEPIVQYGPFVMNTKEQIIAAMDDYRAGRLA
jgi:hypothetical protein